MREDIRDLIETICEMAQYAVGLLWTVKMDLMYLAKAKERIDKVKQ